MEFLTLTKAIGSNGLSAGVLMQLAFSNARKQGASFREAVKQAACVAYAVVEYLIPDSITMPQEAAIAAQDAALYFLTTEPNYVPPSGALTKEAALIRDEVLQAGKMCKGILLSTQNLSTTKLEQDVSLLKQDAKALQGRWPIPVSAIVDIGAVNMRLNGMAGLGAMESWSDVFTTVAQTAVKDIVAAGGDIVKAKLTPTQTAALQKAQAAVSQQTGVPAAQVTMDQIAQMVALQAQTQAQQQAAATKVEPPAGMTTTTKWLIGGGVAAAVALLVGVVALRR